MHPEFSFVKLDVERQKEIESFLCSGESCKMRFDLSFKVSFITIEKIISFFLQVTPLVLSVIYEIDQSHALGYLQELFLLKLRM